MTGTRPTLQKSVELDYFPTREGGIDQLHTHPFYPGEEERESCGACTQLSNDFAWLRFNDAMAGREGEFGTVEDAMKYAVVSAAERNDPRTNTFRNRVASAA